MKIDNYDFTGLATKNNLKCKDGRTIMNGAFNDCDGVVVPMVWHHQWDKIDNVLGHALLKKVNEGIRAYCFFNDTESGQKAKKVVQHGDVSSLSIYADELVQQGSAVMHGIIREVSLVLAGANPGAKIDNVIQHGDQIYYLDDNAGVITTGEGVTFEGSLEHSGMDDKEDSKDPNESKKDTESEDGEETIQDIYNSMTDKQKDVVALVAGSALEAAGETDDNDDEGGNNNMKHNLFENEEQQNDAVLVHDAMQRIFANAKQMGSFRQAINASVESGDYDIIKHSLNTTGMTVATGTQNYGVNDASMLFPDYKSLTNTPEFISRNMDWVQDLMGEVHHTPFSRIKSIFADITEDEARARGYIKGKQKKEEVFTTLKRTTDPQTVYKKQKLDRDDIVDITDIAVVAWIRAEMRVMLNEEIARAILIGDGRPADSDDKIQELHIRPIAKDVPLFNTKVEVSVANDADEGTIADTTIDSIIRARKKYKGSGNPIFFTTEDVLTEMLLLKDGIGHKLYKTVDELATALRVRKIVTVEVMEGQEIDDLPVIGVIVNPRDYNVGADKGGEITMFDDFDIDFNQYKYLIETRISGALVKPFSALTVLLKKAAASSSAQPAVG